MEASAGDGRCTVLGAAVASAGLAAASLPSSSGERLRGSGSASERSES